MLFKEIPASTGLSGTLVWSDQQSPTRSLSLASACHTFR